MTQTTYSAKPGEIERRWYVIDADGETLGRLSTRIANTLRGKLKPQYTAHVDTGDFVVVINCERIRVTGNKLQQKIYYNHSGYHGGLRERTLAQMLDTQARRSHPACRPRHVAAQQTRPRAAAQAQAVRRRAASTRGAAACAAAVANEGKGRTRWQRPRPIAAPASARRRSHE